MARSFAGAQYIALPDSSNPSTAWTIAVVSSHNSTANAACALMLSVTNTSLGSVENSIACYFRGDTGGDPVQNRMVDNGAGGTVNSGTGYGANTLTSIVARSSAPTSASVFINGSKADNTITSRDGFPATQFTIGAGIIFSASYSDFITGDACNVAYWNVALTDDECASLGKGFAPRRIRPQQLIRYLPLVRDAIEWKQGASLTLSGTPPGVSSHARSYGF